MSNDPMEWYSIQWQEEHDQMEYCPIQWIRKWSDDIFDPIPPPYYTLKRSTETIMKTPQTFENGFKSGDVWKRIVLKTLRFQCGQVKTKALKPVTWIELY